MVPPQSKADLKLIFGATVGAVLAICVVLLLFLLRRNPQEAMATFRSFMRTSSGLQLSYTMRCDGHLTEKEVKLALSITFEVPP